MKQLTGIALVCLVTGGLIGLERTPRNDPEAVRLLQEAAQAPSLHDFTAQATTFGNYGNRVLQTEATIYNARGGHSRIEYRLGSLAGVITGQNGPGMNWRFDPMNRSLVTDVGNGNMKPRPAGVEDPNIAKTMEKLLSNCRVTMVKETQVAGRDAGEVLVKCKNKGETRLLWIDKGTGVILRQEERNPENELVSATVYRSITYGKTAPPDQFLPIPPSGAPVRWLPESDFATPARYPDQLQRAIGAPLAKPRYIPDGYSREGYYLYKCSGCGLKSAVTRYVNGLDSLTIVQSPKEIGQHANSQPLDFGIGKAVFVQRGKSSFWVLGELPESDLKRVLNSLGD